MPVSNLYAEMMMGIDPEEEEQGLATPTDRAVFKPVEQHIPPPKPFDIGKRITPPAERQKIKPKGFDLGVKGPDTSQDQVIPRKAREGFNLRGGVTPPAARQQITAKPFALEGKMDPVQSIPPQRFNVRGGITPPVATQSIQRKPFNVGGGLTPAQVQQNFPTRPEVRGGMVPAQVAQTFARGKGFNLGGTTDPLQASDYNKRTGDNAQGESSTLAAALTGDQSPQAQGKGWWQQSTTERIGTAWKKLVGDKGVSTSKWADPTGRKREREGPPDKGWDTGESAGPPDKGWAGERHGPPDSGWAGRPEQLALGGQQGDPWTDPRQTGNYIPLNVRQQLAAAARKTGGGGGARRGGGTRGGKVAQSRVVTTPGGSRDFNFVTELDKMGQEPDVNFVELAAQEGAAARAPSVVGRTVLIPDPNNPSGPFIPVPVQGEGSMEPYGAPPATPNAPNSTAAPTRPRRVGEDPTDPERMQSMIDAMSPGTSRNRYYNAEDQYKYKNEMVHGEEKHKGWGRLKHAGLTAVLGMMANARPNAQGHYDLGSILGGGISGGLLGGIKPELADSAYNRLIVGPEAERERAKQLAAENIKFEQSKQGLTLDQMRTGIAGQQQSQKIAGETHTQNTANQSLLDQLRQAQLGQTQATTQKIQAELSQPNLPAGTEYATQYDPQTGKWNYVKVGLAKGKGLDASQLVGDITAEGGSTSLKDQATAAVTPEVLRSAMQGLFGGEFDTIQQQLQAAYGGQGQPAAGRKIPTDAQGRQTGEPTFTWGPNQTPMAEGELEAVSKRFAQMRQQAQEYAEAQMMRLLIDKNKARMSQYFGTGITPRQAGQTQGGGGGGKKGGGPMRAWSSLPGLNE